MVAPCDQKLVTILLELVGEPVRARRRAASRGRWELPGRSGPPAWAEPPSPAP